LCYDIGTIYARQGKPMKEYFAKLKYLFKWRDLVFALVLFTLILTVAFCRAENMMDVTFGESAVDIHTSRFNMNIPYDMVESIEIGDINKHDKTEESITDIALRTGQWTSETWGEYSACLDMQTSKCILVHLNDGRLFAFSHKSDEKVQQDFETLQSYLNQ